MLKYSPKYKDNAINYDHKNLVMLTNKTVNSSQTSKFLDSFVKKEETKLSNTKSPDSSDEPSVEEKSINEHEIKPSKRRKSCRKKSTKRSDSLKKVMLILLFISIINIFIDA